MVIYSIQVALLYEWMTEWMTECMNEWMNEWMNDRNVFLSIYNA